MRILITGGTGVVGSALVKEFLNSNWEVYVLSRKEHLSSEKNLKYLLWDGVNLGEWQDVINEVDAIINLSGESIGGTSFAKIRWTRARKTRIVQSRINGGKVLTKAVQEAENKPEVFIQVSAVGYYGIESQEVVTEESGPGNDFLADTCRLWEESTELIENEEVRRVVARFGVVISSDNPIIGFMALPFKMFIGGQLGNGEQFFTWIHIQDLIQIIKLLVTDEKFSGDYNVTAPESVRNIEVSRILGSVLRRPNWFPTPAFGLKLLLGEASTLILDGQNVKPKKLLESGYEFKFTDLEAALEDVIGKKKYIRIG